MEISQVDKLVTEIGSASVHYYRPVSHIIVMRLEDEEYSPIRYIISDSDDGDYGCFVVRCESFSDFRFDWYSGMWSSDDGEVQMLLENDQVRAALSEKFGDIAICLGPNGRGESLYVWKKIISRCLRDDDSLVDEIDVMFEHENAQCSNPACVPPGKDEDWNRLKSFTNGR